MNGFATFAIMAQALVTLVGGGYALWKFAVAHGRDQAKIDRVLRQVEPNGGGSLRDDVTTLGRDFRAFREEMRSRVSALERAR